MAAGAEDGPEALDDRFARLIDRLLIEAEAAAASSAWDRASAIAEDILSVAPADGRASAMLERARAERSLPHGQRAFVSVLFSDIVRSTDLAEVADPEIVRDLFKIYREAGTEAIQEMGGHVLQFQGDGIVACFGYPTVHEDDAKRAVLAALGLIERMTAHAPELWDRYGVELALRIGIHTGTVVVTSPETGTALASSDVVGAALNVAARLQGEAAPNTVVISGTTSELVAPHFEMESIGARDLRGIARTIEVFRVVRPYEGVAPQAGDPSATVAIVNRSETRRELHRAVGGGRRVRRRDPGAGAGRGAERTRGHRQVPDCRRAVRARSCRGRRGALRRLLPVPRERRPLAHAPNARAEPGPLPRAGTRRHGGPRSSAASTMQAFPPTTSCPCSRRCSPST